MDYEKKYKEALEELKQCDRYDIEPAKTILKIFPELEESDYIIKQRLKHLLGYFRSRGIDHDLCNRILNWLEKQGEKALTVDVDSMVEAYRQRHLNQGIIFKNSPVTNMCINMCVAAYKRGIENTLDKLHLKQSEQNLTWSEEDKERIKQICEDLKCGLENFRSGKSVKGLHFEEIINSNIDWLKSLKPQPQWKPTEEQMEALNVVCKCYYIVHILSNNDYEKIKSLYNDLKNFEL